MNWPSFSSVFALDYQILMFFLLFTAQVMIPLSLYVTIELCKILQVFHIHNNYDLFDIKTNKRTECRAMNITEELGQVINLIHRQIQTFN